MEIFLEKYRPKKFEEIVGNKERIDEIKAMVSNGDIPHLILEGTAGIGKTTTANVIGRILFEENFRGNFLELNASDDRGIDVVRGIIKTFAKTSPLGSGFKILLLDEADSLTPDAQEALRRVIEKYSNITRFIFCCNHIEDIIDPIQSRCQKLHFSPVSSEEMIPRLKFIMDNEKLSYDESGLKALADNSYGDMRKAINWIQVLASTKVPLTSESFEKNKSSLDYYEKILDSLIKGRFLEARKICQDLLMLGYNERDIISELHKRLISKDSSIISDATKGACVLELAETDYRLTLGQSRGLQLDALLVKLMSVFKTV